MKLFAFLGLVILLVSSPVGMSSAKMYWDGSTDTDVTVVGGKDVQPKPASRQVTPSRVKMYDDYKILDIDRESETERDARQEMTPIRRRPAVTSIAPSRRRNTTPPSEAGSRRPEGKRAEPAQAITDRPKPVSSSPGKSPGSETRATDDLQKQGSEKGEITAPPPTKKMPWGQVDVKPSEPEEKNLKWGEKSVDR